MNIQYYGHSCFKITTKSSGRGSEEITVFLDPFDKSIGLRPPQGNTDIVVISHDHSDHNNAAALKGDFRIIDIPGEYSIKGINIIGFSSFHDTKNGAERGLNTVFILESENLRICHLGDLGCELTEKQLEIINGIDVLMIPVGGKHTLDGKMAAEVVKKIEPKIIIPMHFKIKGTNLDIDDEKKFCNEIGNCPAEKVSRLSLKKKDLEEKNMEVITMGIE
jgi:L-ascorbate metabolism protein UlaG (beta-lactamase superfamily)